MFGNKVIGHYIVDAEVHTEPNGVTIKNAIGQSLN